MTVVSVTRWLASLARKTCRRNVRLEGRPSRRSYRLALDALEDRTTPSTFLVTTGVDPVGKLVPGSLRWAIAQANLPRNQGSTVEITPAVQSAIALHAGELPIRSSMTIENGSGLPLTIQQATPNSRVFHVVANPRTTAVTITGQSASSLLTLTGGHVRNGNGGGILVDNPQNVLTAGVCQRGRKLGRSSEQSSARYKGERRGHLFERDGDARSHHRLGQQRRADPTAPRATPAASTPTRV